MDRKISGVGVLDKAVAILGTLESGPHSLAELVAATGIARPTAHRLAVALEFHRLVEQVIRLASRVEFFDVVFVDGAKIHHLLPNRRLVAGQHVVGDLAELDAEFREQVDVVAEQKVLAARRQGVAQRLGHILEVLEAQQVAGEERQLGVARLRHRDHLALG